MHMKKILDKEVSLEVLRSGLQINDLLVYTYDHDSLNSDMKIGDATVGCVITVACAGPEAPLEYQIVWQHDPSISNVLYSTYDLTRWVKKGTLKCVR